MCEAPIRQLTLLASSDEQADRNAALLSRRLNVHAVSLLRWVKWDEEAPSLLRMPQAQRCSQTSEAAVDSLPVGLRSLLISEFAMTASIPDRLCRYSDPTIRDLLTVHRHICWLCMPVQ